MAEMRKEHSFWYYIGDGQDGSASVMFFRTMEEADAEEARDREMFDRVFEEAVGRFIIVVKDDGTISIPDNSTIGPISPEMIAAAREAE